MEVDDIAVAIVVVSLTIGGTLRSRSSEAEGKNVGVISAVGGSRCSYGDKMEGGRLEMEKGKSEDQHQR